MTEKKPNRFTGPNWKWLTAFVAAMLMIFAFITALTAVTLRGEVERTNDQLQCVLYEVNAHRVESQRDADFENEDREPKTEPALDLPNKLRESCEEILPGSTERGQPE